MAEGVCQGCQRHVDSLIYGYAVPLKEPGAPRQELAMCGECWEIVDRKRRGSTNRAP